MTKKKSPEPPLPRGWTRAMVRAEQDVVRKLTSLMDRGLHNDGIAGRGAVFGEKLDSLVKAFDRFKRERDAR